MEKGIRVTRTPDDGHIRDTVDQVNDEQHIYWRGWNAAIDRAVEIARKHTEQDTFKDVTISRDIRALKHS
jgi:hypothetical protein